MLRYLLASEATSPVFEWIERAAVFIEVLAVGIIVFAILAALARYLVRYATNRGRGDLYHELKVSLGKALLLGLEVLVAADIVHTVALEATKESVFVLGLLVLIRTFLSWALVVEIEGHWPWQPRHPNPVALPGATPLLQSSTSDNGDVP
ncbi:MAG TPA: DUF1622 domain-containing protein [Anaerolineae bacterium]|nr:DUF1622 domain-containing protein [Anaerolineae bacterium]